MQKILLYISLFLIGICSLGTFLTVWFDEAYFAEITYQLLNSNGFHSQADTVSLDGKPVYIYGPVYFLLTSAVAWLTELSPFYFRLVNYLAYFGVVLLLGSNIHKNKLGYWGFLFSIVLFFDNAGFENALSGRMEAVALLFALSSYLLYYQFKVEKKDIYSFLIGLSVSLSFLTTPRAAILLIPLFFIVIFDLIKLGNWKFFFTLALSFSIPVLIWILTSHGSLQAFIEYYTQNSSFESGESTLVEQYLYSGLRFTKVKMVVYTLFIFSFLVKRNLSKRDAFLVKVFGANALLFIFLVNDTGSYFALVSPLMTYCIFVNLLHSNFKFKRSVLLIYSGFNLFMVTAKFAYNYLNEYKDYSPILSMVEENIPNEATVITDFDFFYALREKNTNLYFFQMGKDPVTRTQYHINELSPQYILTKIDDPKMSLYNKNFNYDIIARYPKKENPNYWIVEGYIKKLGGHFFTVDYENLVIYKLYPIESKTSINHSNLLNL